MQLPIDLSTAPYKPKYLDEETPLLAYWMDWGGDVCVAGGGCEEVFVRGTPAQHARLIAARKRFVDEILSIVNG